MSVPALPKSRIRRRLPGLPPTNNARVRPDDDNEEKPYRTKQQLRHMRRAIKKANQNTWTTFMRALSGACGFFLGLLTYIFVMWLLVDGLGIFVPPCPEVNGRTCNSRGACLESGLCACDQLFSGPACGDTLVPGYTPATNEECSGNGRAYPFVEITEPCEVVQTLSGTPSGGGWGAESCREHIRLLRESLADNAGIWTATPNADEIPQCFCEPGWKGEACSLLACPIDENNLVCAGRGDPQVGILGNFTTVEGALGNGCQCRNIVSLESLKATFPSDTYTTLLLDHGVLLETRYCGTIHDASQDVKFLQQSDDDYACFCREGWMGLTCTEGKCPTNVNTNVVCSGHGHAGFGFGLLRNTTSSTDYAGEQCPVECLQDYSVCTSGSEAGLWCSMDQSTTVPEYSLSAYCEYPAGCPDQAPVRCATGECVLIPGSALDRECLNGKESGQIDVTQLHNSLSAFECGNFTDQEVITSCFLNQTSLESITGLGADNRSLILAPEGEINVLLDDSPLLFFSLLVTYPGDVTVTNWLGDSITSTDPFREIGRQSAPREFQGSFQITHSAWERSLFQQELGLLDNDQGVQMTSAQSNDGLEFWVYPLPAPLNYSASLSFPTEMQTFKLSDPVTLEEFVLDAIDSDVQLEALEDPASGPILVLGKPALADPDQASLERWLWPLGGAAGTVSRGKCLSDVQFCAWYLDETLDQLRNMDSSLFVCPDPLDTDHLTTQTSVCATTFSAQLAADATRFSGFFSRVLGRSRVQVAALHTLRTFDLLGAQEDRDFGFKITVGENFDNVSSLQLHHASFLTQQRITFDCACAGGVQQHNRSRLNHYWFQQGVSRAKHITSVEVGDFVLAERLTQGDKELVRGRVSEVDELSESVGVLPLKGYMGETVFYSFLERLRGIAPFETLQGWDDTTRAIAPARCQDGSRSRLQTGQLAIPVDCNCTMGPINVFSCDCLDPDFSPGFGCTCDTLEESCECGFPATKALEVSLLDITLGVARQECVCHVLHGDTQGSILQLAPDTSTFELEVSGLQGRIPVGLRVKWQETNNCTQTDQDFTLSAAFLASTFWDNETEITLLGSETEPGQNVSCDKLFLPLRDNVTLAQESIVVRSLSPIAEVEVFFSEDGLSMTVMDPPEVVVVSEDPDHPSENILVPDDNWWATDPSMSQSPSWVQYRFSKRWFAGKSLVQEETTGPTPERVYIQGSNDLGLTWHTLGSFQGGGVVDLHETVVDPTPEAATPEDTAYLWFRLASPGSYMSIKRWDLFAKADCNCRGLLPVPGLADIVLSMTLPDDVSNLPTVTNWLESIETDERDAINQPGCIAVDDCNLRRAGVVFANATANGVCNDAEYVSRVLRQDVAIVEVESSLSTPVPIFDTADSGPLFSLITVPGYPEVEAVVQWAPLLNATDNTTGVMTEAQLQAYYPFWALGLTPWAHPETNEDLLETTVLFLAADLSVLFRLGDAGASGLLDTSVYINGTNNVTTRTVGPDFGELTLGGFACPPGHDQTDCGPAGRAQLLMPGVGCSLNSTQQLIKDDIAARSSFVSTDHVYYLSRLGDVNGTSAFIQNIVLERIKPVFIPEDCPSQTCSLEYPHRCTNGACVRWEAECEPRYNCPGSGCVQLPDISRFGHDVYRCACERGWNGNACQFKHTRPAVPREKFPSSPVSEEATCGGMPPLREKPPVLNIGDANFLPTTDDVIAMNRREAENAVPRGPLDIDYHRVMPQAAPFGKIIRREVRIDPSGSGASIDPTDQLVYTTCGFARKGAHGEQILLTDDVVARDPDTGEVTEWADDDFQWDSIATYDHFPYRCPNGQCVAHFRECLQSEELFPICGGHGMCLADGTCECEPGWRTFTVSESFTEGIDTPYEFDFREGETDPTRWLVNYNWRNYGLNWCSARDCRQEGSCDIGYGCFLGTTDLGLGDALVECQNLGGRKCAPSTADCRARTRLQDVLPCSGKGIPREKDFTGGVYCHCGDPIDPFMDIRNITSISQLKKNGFGGPTCSHNSVPDSTPVWSSWDWEHDRAYLNSDLEDLPGKWVGFQGAHVGADPADIVNWRARDCCPANVYPALEMCPMTLCVVAGEEVCVPAQDCIAPDVPLVYACNNHGTPRPDQTCDCETSETTGEGHATDPDQYSEDNCFREVRCPESSATGTPCGYMDECQNPAEWRHPIPKDLFLEQQWLSAGLSFQGEPKNITRAMGLETAQDNFNELLLQTISDIANSVRAAQVALAGCVCVGPGDDLSGMSGVPHNPKYKLAFNRPFEIAGSFDSSAAKLSDELFLTPPDDGGGGANPTAMVLPAGSTVSFTPDRLDIEYTLHGVRLFQYVASNVTSTHLVVSQGASTLCEADIPADVVTSLKWLYISCIENYQVSPLDPDDFEECALNERSEECTDALTEACRAIPGDVWTIDAPSNIFPGCDRDLDIDITCCVRVGGTVPTFSGGSIDLDFTVNPIQVAEARIYGFGEQVEDVPSGLQERISFAAGRNTTCQDELLLARLGGTGTYYAPLDLDDLPADGTEPQQETLDHEEAFQRCRNTGGYLAISQDLADPAVVYHLRQACSVLPGAQRCYVGAKQRDASLDLSKTSEYIQSKCQANGCFETPRGALWGPKYFVGLVRTDDVEDEWLYDIDTPIVSGQVTEDAFLQSIPDPYRFYNAWLSSAPALLASVETHKDSYDFKQYYLATNDARPDVGRGGGGPTNPYLHALFYRQKHGAMNAHQSFLAEVNKGASEVWSELQSSRFGYNRNLGTCRINFRVRAISSLQSSEYNYPIFMSLETNPNSGAPLVRPIYTRSAVAGTPDGGGYYRWYEYANEGTIFETAVFQGADGMPTGENGFWPTDPNVDLDEPVPDTATYFMWGVPLDLATMRPGGINKDALSWTASLSRGELTRRGEAFLADYYGQWHELLDVGDTLQTLNINSYWVDRVDDRFVSPAFEDRKPCALASFYRSCDAETDNSGGQQDAWQQNPGPNGLERASNGQAVHILRRSGGVAFQNPDFETKPPRCIRISPYIAPEDTARRGEPLRIMSIQQQQPPEPVLPRGNVAFQNGPQEYPYRPMQHQMVFLEFITPYATVNSRLGQVVSSRFTTRIAAGSPDIKPVFFATRTFSSLAIGEYMEDFLVDASEAGQEYEVKQCSDCFAANHTPQWDQHRWAENPNNYQNNIDDMSRSPIELLDAPAENTVANTEFSVLLSLRQNQQWARYTYAIAFGVRGGLDTPAYHSDTVISRPRSLDCYTVGANTSLAVPEPISCSDRAQYICTYSTTRYSVVRGHQCIGECGPGSRTSIINPNITCFEEFSLADPAQFPLQHELEEAERLGVAQTYIDAFTFENDEVDLGDKSVIFGFPDAWEAWAQQLCNWGAQGFHGRVTTGDQNWICFSQKKIYPTSCGTLVDPITRQSDRYCASTRNHCSLSTPLKEFSPIQDSERPPFLDAVRTEDSTRDKTCGRVIPLDSYLRIDKWGLAQNSLDDTLSGLELSSTGVTFQVEKLSNSLTYGWFNSGKSPADYAFKVDETVTVAGRYALNCPTCPGSATFTVFIHPIDPEYTRLPLPRIDVLVLPLVTTGVLTLFEAEFTVSTLDEGDIIEVGGLSFPSNIYKGVGFEFYNLPVGAVVELENPVITDAASRLDCETREPETWYQPLTRIRSAVPHNKCLIKPADLELFPGRIAGECACALPFGGAACECPATLSKFGANQVCGGYGDSQGVALSPGNGEEVIRVAEEGCLAFQTTFAGIEDHEIRDCKCLDMGRVYFTTMVGPAAFGYPYVTVEVPPVGGIKMFFLDVNPIDAWFAKTEVLDECLFQGAQLPFFASSDELDSLVNEFNVDGGVFTDMEYNGALQWWFPTSGLFFSSDEQGTEITSCVSFPTACAAMNFNNLAYLNALTVSQLTDGDIATWVDHASGEVGWGQNTITVVDVVVVMNGNTGISAASTYGVTQLTAIPVYVGPHAVSGLYYVTVRVMAPEYRVSISNPSNHRMYEMQVFHPEDTTRFPHYYT